MPNVAKMTKKKERALDYIKEYALDNYGQLPTYRKILENTDYGSTSEIFHLLKALVRLGKLRWIDEKAGKYYIVGSKFTIEA